MTATYTGRSVGEVHELLDRFGIYMPHVLVDAARQDVTTEHHAFGSVSALVNEVWLHAEARHPSNGAERFTLSMCNDHDDSHGCCDACGRWRNRPASETWNERTTEIAVDRIMSDEAGQ